MRFLQFEGLPDGAVLDGILRLHDRIFGEGQSGRLLAEAAGKQRLLAIVALAGDRVVGYKIGYERTSGGT
ncbi:MAG: hypothetical protein LOD90_10640 [Symbiobacteriaceae bacterium]